MTVQTETDVRTEIKEHIDKSGARYPTWYVGIAADPRDRLFNGHGVKEKGDWWIVRYCESADAARRVEEYFLGLGCEGGAGGGDPSTTGVYAYRKSSHTRP